MSTKTQCRAKTLKGENCKIGAKENGLCHLHQGKEASFDPKPAIKRVIPKTTGELGDRHRAYCHDYKNEKDCVRTDTCIWKGNMCQKGWGKDKDALLRKKDSAATKIKALYKGYKTRKELSN